MTIGPGKSLRARVIQEMMDFMLSLTSRDCMQISRIEHLRDRPLAVSARRHISSPRVTRVICSAVSAVHTCSSPR